MISLYNISSAYNITQGGFIVWRRSVVAAVLVALKPIRPVLLPQPPQTCIETINRIKLFTLGLGWDKMAVGSFTRMTSQLIILIEHPWSRQKQLFLYRRTIIVVRLVSSSFFLVTLQVHWQRFFCYTSPCNFLRKLPTTFSSINCNGLCDHWTQFENIKIISVLWAFLPRRGAIDRLKNNISHTLQSSPNRFKWTLGGFNFNLIL